MYANREVITKIKAEITRFKQPASMRAVGDTEAFRNNGLRCGMVRNEPLLIGIFIEDQHYSIPYSMRSYREHTKNVHYKAWRVMRQTW